MVVVCVNSTHNDKILSLHEASCAELTRSWKIKSLASTCVMIGSSTITDCKQEILGYTIHWAKKGNGLRVLPVHKSFLLPMNWLVQGKWSAKGHQNVPGKGGGGGGTEV